MQSLSAESAATVLVVDDAEINRAMLSRRLCRDGHRVVVACDGAEALELVREQSFDLILLDIMMPIMDGYQVLETLKKEETLRHIPVIMITALNDIESIARCIELGAEDYLPKPFNSTLLKARINASLHKKQAHDLQQRYRDRIEEHNALLELNARRQTEENHLVAHLMAQMMHSPGLRDDHVRYWISASELVSGDLVAAARNGHDKLFIMLADSTGHGLPAALNLLPINRIFYRMVEKGFPVPAIVEEMNRTIKQQSPPDRFVAAVVASIDATNRTIELWNGGVPPAVFCDKIGAVKRTFPSTSFPLGIVGDGFPARTQIYQWECDGQLIMFSDGLLEAEDDQGSPFGFERMAAALGDVPDEERFDKLVNHLHDHLGERLAHDDVSLLMTHCITAEA
jgi:CheY-like chemotaxis protein/serine phosphatase RsbU (regulator of sigma subunit)